MPLVRSGHEYRAWRELQPLLREDFLAAFSPTIFGEAAWPPVFFVPKL